MMSGTYRSPLRSEHLDDASDELVAAEREAPSVLVVEDDPDVLELVAEALADAGYRVLGARDGIDVLEDRAPILPGFGTFSGFEIVVTDLIMPQVSGLELLQHLRGGGWPGSAVVITAFADHELWTQALELGATAVLHKPFYVDDLVRLVERLAPLEAMPR